FVDQLGPAVVVARLLQGVGQAMTMTAFWTYIADRVPVENRTQGIALFGISGLAPIGIAPALGDLILTGNWGYRGLFLAAAGFSVGAFALSMFLERSGVHTGAATSGFGSVLRSPELRPIWLVSLFVSLGFTTAFIFVKTYVATSHLGTVGPFFAAYASMAVAWRLAFAWVPDRVGPARMIPPGLGLYALGLAVLGLVPSTLGLVVGGIFTGLGHGISYPVILGIATVRAAPRARGTATAIFTAVFDLTLFAASPVIGAAIGLFGYRAMFLGVAFVITLGALGFTRIDRTARMAMHPAATGGPAIAPVPHA
ncbi:MAG TPA: MFS transporter, partial [Acidimicrobiia bacterium]|nr:MFS transporter [Acidimicrobiia bacterium]